VSALTDETWTNRKGGHMGPPPTNKYEFLKKIGVQPTRLFKVP